MDTLHTYTLTGIQGMPQHRPVSAPVPIPVRVQALSFGPEATLLLAGERLSTGIGVEVELHPLAHLSAVLYLCSPRGYVVCVASEQAEDGPLMVRVNHTDIYALLAANATGVAESEEKIEIQLDLSNAQRWVPRLPEISGSLQARLEAAQVLTSILLTSVGPDSNKDRRMCACGGGLGTVGFSLLASILWDMYPGEPHRPSVCAPPFVETGVEDHTDPSLNRAARHLSRFYAAVAGGGQSQQVAEALAGLLGLGPGLTPSGDDVVMGLLAALVWQAKDGLLSKAWVGKVARAMQQAAPRCTNRISARLLWHAATGVLHAPAMRVGAALMAGDLDAVRREAPSLLAIGSTSGADLAVGLLAGTLCMAGGWYPAPPGRGWAGKR